MPVIMTSHIAKSSKSCHASHAGGIIHAALPRMSPYMSRAIGTIHAQERPTATINAAPITQRSRMSAASSALRSLTTA